MANIRIERLESTFQEELSMILMTEIKDEDIHFVTITGCDITSDLSFAKVYVTVLEEEKKKEILEKMLKESLKEMLRLESRWKIV